MSAPTVITRLESAYEKADPNRCFSCDVSIAAPALSDEGFFRLGIAALIIKVCAKCAGELASVPVNEQTYARTAELACKRYPDVMSKAMSGLYS